MDTINFDITIGQRTGDGYPAQARCDPLGTAFDLLAIAPTQPPLASLLAWAAGAVSEDSAQLESIEALGRELYQGLCRGSLGEFLRSALQHAEARGMALRLRLGTDDLGMLSLPWEFLYDETRNRLFATDQDSPLVRYLSDYGTFGPPRPLAAALPLRMLMVVPAVDGLDVQAETDRVRDALMQGDLLGRQIQLSQLNGSHEPVTIQRLRDVLQEDAEGFDILHFSGHGDTARGRGHIRFNSSAGGEKWISSGTFARTLKPYTARQTRRPLRLVVLNACEGGISAPKAYGVRSLLGMAPALIQNGVAAVVAMQYQILDVAALSFARSFYRAMVLGTTAGLVDAAITDARQGLAAEFEGHRSFATPVLFLHTVDGLIFNLPPTLTTGADAVPLPRPEVSMAIGRDPTPQELARLQEAWLAFRTPRGLKQRSQSLQQSLEYVDRRLEHIATQLSLASAIDAVPLLGEKSQADGERKELLQELHELSDLVELAQRLQIPDVMTFNDFLLGLPSDTVLAFLLAPLPGVFDDRDVVARLRSETPAFARRVAQRLLQKPDASDAELAAALHGTIQAFVDLPSNGFTRAPRGKYRRIAHG